MTIHPRVKSLVERVGRADVFDRAAALTYWSFLSLFPALIILVALLGLIGELGTAHEQLIESLRDAAPGPAVEMIDRALDDAVRTRGGIGGLLGVGLLLTLYSASAATGAAVRGVEAVYGLRHNGAWWHGYAVRLALTVALGLMLLLAFAAILLAGPVFDWASDLLGISDQVNTLVAVVRWPIAFGSLLAITVLLYWVGSGRRHRFLALLPGAAAAIAVILIATFGFNLYVSNFENLGATYGSLGAVIVLLIWIWLSSLALLLGAAVNAELKGISIDGGTGRTADRDAIGGTDTAGRSGRGGSSP